MEIAAANLHAADVHHQVFIVEFSVCIFKWLLYPFYVFYNVQCSYQIHIHLRSIPHQTDDGMGFSNGNMGFNPHAVNPRFQVFQLFRFCILFQYNNHSTYLLHDKTLPFIAAYPSFLQKKKDSAANFTAKSYMSFQRKKQQNEPSFPNSKIHFESLKTR